MSESTRETFFSNQFKIAPSIGVARVGNSQEFYLAPEQSGGLPIVLKGGGQIPIQEIDGFQPSDFRDSTRKMRRQGVRFRIYYFPREGKPQEIVVGSEIRSDQGEIFIVEKIEWTVRLANKKASWYKFDTLDGSQGYPPNHPLRNSQITDPEQRREQLIIDPGSRTLTKPNQVNYFSRDSHVDYPMTFPRQGLKPEGNDINSLGEIYTDPQGRLIVVGGFGHSGTTANVPNITTYANNDDWFDDTSDGSVSVSMVLCSTVENTSEQISPLPAWVLVTPPAYAPQILNMVTLYDTMLDVAVREMNYRPDIYQDSFWNSNYLPDFEREIQPILERASSFPWVTAIPPKPHTFDYKLLGNPDPAYNSLRQYFFSQVRPPNQANTLKSSTTGYPMMPYLAGDDATGGSQKSSKFLTLTQTQYFLLQQWATGNFTNAGSNRQALNPVDELTRASLENCVGGAFSPGIEMTWISRNVQLYAEPFRIKPKDLTPTDRLNLGLNLELGLEPGDISKFMALPWQADFNECSSQPLDNRYVWWWPAQRPEFVYLPPKLPEFTRLAVAPSEEIKQQQVPWIGTDYDQTAPDYIAFANDVEMVEKWHLLGFILDISPYEEYKPALESIDWQGSYYAEIDRELPRNF